jgi:lipoprotein-releasing system ATP-binding protein
MQAEVETHNQSEPELDHGSGLIVSDLRKTFTAPNGSRVEVLRGAGFTVAPGECVAIRGASGSGKSTLLNLIGGLDSPDHGRIALDRADISGMSAREITQMRQSQIGFIFQFHYLLSDLNALENVMMPLLITRTARSKAILEGHRLLSEMQLEDRIDYPVSHLSGGEQQRVAVARALIRKPRLLLADEPTGNLDAAVGEDIGKILAGYAHQESAIVIVTTHNESLARLCDRELRLENGKIYSS